MTNQEQIDAINRWQNSPLVHPLTCGNDSCHRNLEAKEVDGKVVLVCLDCDYAQKWVPEVVLRIDPKSLIPFWD